MSFFNFFVHAVLQMADNAAAEGGSLSGAAGAEVKVGDGTNVQQIVYVGFACTRLSSTPRHIIKPPTQWFCTAA
jgi:hypothetical protein